MTKFQDSQWAMDLDPVALETIARPVPVRSSQETPPAADAMRRNPHTPSGNWFDSSWDLHCGTDVAELTELPAEFREALGGEPSAGPAS